MRVLHLFDRYLNGTMNWAYQLLAHTPGTEQHVTAPILIDNAFLQDAPFHIWPSPLFLRPAASEWQVHAGKRWLSTLGTRSGLYQRYLVRRIRREKIDILHAHFAGVGWQALSVARRSKKPLVVSFYGYDYEQLPYRRPVFRQRYRQLFQQATRILTEGPHGAQILQSMGCPAAKIRIVPLGVRVQDIPWFNRQRTPGQLRLFQAATFTEKKGHIYTLQAFREALPHCPGLSLHLMGEEHDPKLVRQLKQYIADHQLQDHIHFLPFTDPARFHTTLRNYDVFIHPSCYAADRDCEGGAPVVLLDAQATGLPVIATEHCDIPREVEHRKTGWLAPERSIAELAAGIRHFYQLDQATYAAYSQRARRLVEARFDIRHNGRTLQNVYRQLLPA